MGVPVGGHQRGTHPESFWILSGVSWAFLWAVQMTRIYVQKRNTFHSPGWTKDGHSQVMWVSPILSVYMGMYHSILNFLKGRCSPIKFLSGLPLSCPLRFSTHWCGARQPAPLTAPSGPRLSFVFR